LNHRHKDLLEGESPSLYHLICNNQRRTALTITQITDAEGNTHTTTGNISRTFLKAFDDKYAAIATDTAAIHQLLSAVTLVHPFQHKHALEQTISASEIAAAIKNGGKRKAPGLDGLPLEFYSAAWDTIQEDFTNTANDMFVNKRTTPPTERKG
jgi:hypothetical protein